MPCARRAGRADPAVRAPGPGTGPGAGVAGVRFAPYIAGTALGIVPGTLVYTGLGDALREPGSPLVWIAPTGLVVLSAFSWWLARLVRSRTAEDPAASGG